MGRIEYEYPLFKVYYSNNSNNSNIRGNPGMYKKLFGIFKMLVILHFTTILNGRHSLDNTESLVRRSRQVK